MRTVCDSKKALSLTAALLVAGCAQFDTGNAARTSAAAALECQEQNTTVTAVSAYRYRGEGCGRSVVVACTAGALEPQCLPEAELASAGGAVERAPEAEASDEIERHIRAGLEGRREDVLACVGRERVGVRVGYAPDGSVDVTLQGELHESPEERCVQDALEGVRVGRGAAGTVVHLLD